MDNKKTSAIIVIVLIVAALAIYGLWLKPKGDDQKPGNSAISSEITITNQATSTANAVSTINNANPKTKMYTAILYTEAGDIEIALKADMTPKTVENFITLAKKNFYDGTIFHRVIKGFMIQGGDPTGTGRGGPGYTFADEPFFGNYDRGTVAMANAGSNTNGSQFFIMQANNPLPKNYVIFGQVTKGLDVVDKIADAPVVASDSGEPSKPVTPVKVKSVEIVEQK